MSTDGSEREGSAEDARCCAAGPAEKGRRTFAAEDGRELGRLALGWCGWYPMRDEEAYREHSCLQNTMDSRRDLTGRGEDAIDCVRAVRENTGGKKAREIGRGEDASNYVRAVRENTRGKERARRDDGAIEHYCMNTKETGQIVFQVNTLSIDCLT